MTLTPIRTDSSNAFAHESMRVRLPELLHDLKASHAYSASIHAALDQLHDEMTEDRPIAPLPLPALDADRWALYFAQHEGETWLQSGWFFAEMFYFRRVMAAVRYWETGHDPYWYRKSGELNAQTRDQIAAGLQTPGDAEARLRSLIERALWGNRADLSHALALAAGTHIDDDDLLIDDRDPAVRQLLDGEGAVHLVIDNFGTELANDLVLVDALLDLGIPVIMHPKMHPTYVSDATVADVHQMLAWIATQPDPLPALASRLQTALDAGRWRLAPDFYWHSPRFINDLPLRLYHLFKGARMVIFKGDANYRRVVNDTLYPVETQLSDLIPHFPAPVLCLRTLKSDPVIGLSQSVAEALQTQDALWRVNGKRGIIQYRG